jgi:GT2 family glycosyltransferase
LRPAAAQPALPSLGPARILDVELTAAIPPVEPVGGGRAYGRAISLVRLHGRPIGRVELDLAAGELSAGAHASAIWSSLAPAVEAHLGADGLPVPDRLGTQGLPFSPGVPPCVEPLRDALANPPMVSVVVATRDGTATLAPCLDSLLALYYPRYEIVVVDSAPGTTAAHDLIEARYAGKGVRYVREDRPGLAVARNRGLREVSGSVVAFTDDDALADPFWLARLAEGFRSARDVACVTGPILPLELETPAQVLLERWGRLNTGFERRLFDLGPNRPSSPLFPYAAGMFGSGANMAFDTAALLELGGFDPAIGAGTRARGGDDLAAFLDVVSSGFTLVYEPSALVWRRYRRESADLGGQVFDYGVGLTAYLTRAAAERPTRLLGLARRLPDALASAFGGGSPRNAASADFPKELARRELLGMLCGPARYVSSRWAARRPRA